MRAFFLMLWSMAQNLWHHALNLIYNVNNALRWIGRLIFGIWLLILIFGMLGDYGSIWFILVAQLFVTAWLFLGPSIAIPAFGRNLFLRLQVWWLRARLWRALAIGIGIVALLFIWMGIEAPTFTFILIVILAYLAFRGMRLPNIAPLWPVFLEQFRYPRMAMGTLAGLWALNIPIGLFVVVTHPERDWRLAAAFMLLIAAVVAFSYAASATGSSAWDTPGSISSFGLAIVIILFLTGGTGAMHERWESTARTGRHLRNKTIQRLPSVKEYLPDWIIGKEKLFDADLDPGTATQKYAWGNWNTLEPDTDPSLRKYLEVHLVDPMGKEQTVSLEAVKDSPELCRAYQKFWIENISRMPIHLRITATKL
jgi:hypothetical protein